MIAINNLFKLNLHPNRIYGLDILRALAIFFVVLGHSAILLPSDKRAYIHLLVFDGVSMFFVLSGFLIGGILIKILMKEGCNLKIILNFWKRRWFRILPIYFFILLVILGLHYFFVDGFIVRDKLDYFIFSQNLFWPHPAFFPEVWSLSIEEWFYLLIPIVLFVLINAAKLPVPKAVLVTAIGILIAVTLFRYYRYVNLDIDSLQTWDIVFRKQVFTRFDILMFGVIGAYLYCFHSFLWKKYRMLFLCFGIILFVIDRYNPFGLNPIGFYGCVFSFTTNALATLFVLPFLSSVKIGKGVVYKCITYISLISYSMYLINFVIVKYWIIGLIDWTFLKSIHGYIFILVRYFMYWFFTIMISILLYKYIELPMMNLRDKKNWQFNLKYFRSIKG